MINKNSKILITGGSGLVGQNLTNRLVSEGYNNIRVSLHAREPRIKHMGVEYWYSDLQTQEGCKTITKDVDVVFHCAASTSNEVDTVNYRLNIMCLFHQILCTHLKVMNQWLRLISYLTNHILFISLLVG
jgi:nucleoside-diphosphate-sugar epimerase